MVDSSGGQKTTTIKLENRVYLIESTMKWSEFFCRRRRRHCSWIDKPLRKTEALAKKQKKESWR